MYRLLHKLLLTGYADEGTGTVKINERLSRERAQAVYDCLVNEFGVKPEKLATDFKGGVENMFYDDAVLSRSVVISLKEAPDNFDKLAAGQGLP